MADVATPNLPSRVWNVELLITNYNPKRISPLIDGSESAQLALG